MKGIIFVELIRMAEDAFGEEAVDTVLGEADLHNDGAFTTVGNYPCSELVKIVLAFSAYSGLSAETLQKKFGHWLMAYFVEHYPELFADKASAFALLESVDREIHVEVRKLYPEAELPRFATRRRGSDRLEMVYSSPNRLDAFCHGMIEACMEYFDQRAEISCTRLTQGESAATFDIRLLS